MSARQRQLQELQQRLNALCWLPMLAKRSASVSS